MITKLSISNKLAGIDPDNLDAAEIFDLTDAEANKKLVEIKAELFDLQHKFYANKKQAFLFIFQGMDTSGKDGVIRSVFGGIDPLGLQISNFKKPTDIEAAHDFLWRAHHRTPEKGLFGIFNRSYYEGVISDPVQGLIDEAAVLRRYNHINQFERMLVDSGTQVIKFFLKISKAEQKDRLIKRMDMPEKRWKLSAADVTERKRWDKYRYAYRHAVLATHQDYAPWYCIPADKKWMRNFSVATIIAEHLRKLDLTYPNPELPFHPKDLDD